MAKRMTAVQIEEILKRAEAATEGPWYWTEDGDALISEKDGEVVGKVVYDGVSEVWFDSWQRDEEFIAHAREDIPALLAEVERLRERDKRAEDLLMEVRYELVDMRLAETNIFSAVDEYLFGGDAE